MALITNRTSLNQGDADPQRHTQDKQRGADRRRFHRRQVPQPSGAMMFDETSFSTASFDERSWFFEVVEAVIRRVKLLQAKFVKIRTDEAFITR